MLVAFFWPCLCLDCLGSSLLSRLWRTFPGCAKPGIKCHPPDCPFFLSYFTVLLVLCHGRWSVVDPLLSVGLASLPGDNCLTSLYFSSCVMVVGLSSISFCLSVWDLRLVSIFLRPVARPRSSHRVGSVPLGRPSAPFLLLDPCFHNSPLRAAQVRATQTRKVFPASD